MVILDIFIPLSHFYFVPRTGGAHNPSLVVTERSPGFVVGAALPAAVERSRPAPDFARAASASCSLAHCGICSAVFSGMSFTFLFLKKKEFIKKEHVLL